MEDITWELKNLDSLKEYIFDELIGEHKNTKDINEAINKYAERYHEMQLKLYGVSKSVNCGNCDSEQSDMYCQKCYDIAFNQ
jgi:predicted metalloprotease